MHSGVGRNVHWEKRGYITPKNYLIFVKKRSNCVRKDINIILKPNERHKKNLV